MAKTSFIIAEPSFLVRKGLISVIQKLDNTEIIQELDTPSELGKSISRYKPDVLILNPEIWAGAESNIKETLCLNPNFKLILLAEQNTSQDFQADAIIEFRDTQNQIITKINQIIKNIEESEDEEKDSETLSSREKIILKHIALGQTNKEIADQLFISIHTVVTHRKHITRKLGIKSVSGLTVYAILNNLISMDEIK